jgi:LmbE family N-acetylglucosaminyl deacetylase
MFKKILVLSPHTDDGELGAGGSIARFVEEGSDVYYAALSGCEISVPEGLEKNTLKTECRLATKTLGIPPDNVILLDYEVRKFPLHRQEILDSLIGLNKKINPDLVLLPSSNDTHQDHSTVHEEGIRAFKKTSSMWGYEHPWNNLTFTTDIFIKLEDRHMDNKIKTLGQYKSQDFKNYFNPDYIKSWAFTRGTEIDVPLAEAFELIRLII